MAYFRHEPEETYEDSHQRVFNAPPEDWVEADSPDWDDQPVDDELDAYDEAEDLDALDADERRQARRGRFRVAAGVGDFFGVIAGTVAILVLIALLVSLVTWVQADISQSFTLWQTRL